jgi:predicted transcriptional regulator of viral defense system
MTKIEKLLNSSLHVFTVQDLAVVWGISDKLKLWNNIRYYLRSNRLKRIHRGLYVVGAYTSFEVAQKLITPSYISFYTALAVHGIIFQVYETIHSVALKSKTIMVGKEKFVYHQLKDEIFFNKVGLRLVETENGRNYNIASPERAVCDSLYLVSGLSFDDLSPINMEKLRDIALIYKNSRLEREVEEIINLGN